MAKGKKAKAKRPASKNGVKKPVKGKAAKKLGKTRPVKKPAAGKGGKKPTIKGLDSKVEFLEGEVAKARAAFVDNELALKKKVSEKNRVEGQLNALLRKKFSAEKRSLSAIKESASRNKASLKKKIASLERINNIYAEKKAKIKNARKRHNALKRQLDLLEKKSGELSIYA